MAESGRLEHILKLQEEYGISQSKLALEAGLTRNYISRIQSGEFRLSDDVADRLEEALVRLNPDAKLNMVFDYVRVRFFSIDTEHILKDILRLKPDYMYHADFGYYNYEEHYELGNIFVMASHEEEKGTLLELKGQGCRQFEGFLEAQGRTWYDFFMECVAEGCVFKRIDLAINDIAGVLDIRELTRKCEVEECVSKFRSFKSYRSGELVRRDEKVGMGYTLYIGSLKSDIYFCIYEKDYEQYVKNDIPIDEVPVKNRFEIRLMNDRADHAMIHLLNCWDGEEVAFGIINNYISFVDRKEDVDREYWPVNKQWAWFTDGETRERLKLTSQPQPYSPERTLRWMAHQVAPSWKAFTEVDKRKGTNTMGEMVEEAQLTDRLEKLVEQLSATTEDMIY